MSIVPTLRNISLVLEAFCGERGISYIFLLWPNKYIVCVGACVQACTYLVTQSCPTLCNSMDCSASGSFVQRISQARILEWDSISCSRGLHCSNIKNYGDFCVTAWDSCRLLTSGPCPNLSSFSHWCFLCNLFSFLAGDRESICNH